jgi:hypothetical protein
MAMEWTLAHPLQDVEDIVELADTQYGQEADGIVKRDRNIFRKNVTLASTYQLFDKGREFLAVCRNWDQNREIYSKIRPEEPIPGGELMGFCWFDRGGYTTYSNEEISNAKFHHLRLDLPARTRVRLVNEMIDQHILWAHTWGIPVVCSTSVRVDHGAFMRIHEKRGFKVTGSYAWIRTEDAIKWMQK